jgi:hypothetical protein
VGAFVVVGAAVVSLSLSSSGMPRLMFEVVEVFCAKAEVASVQIATAAMMIASIIETVFFIKFTIL